MYANRHKANIGFYYFIIIIQFYYRIFNGGGEKQGKMRSRLIYQNNEIFKIFFQKLIRVIIVRYFTKEQIFFNANSTVHAKKYFE